MGSRLAARLGTLALTAGVCAAAAAVHAAEYSVAPGEPVDAQLERLRPGDTLLFRSGVYDRAVVVRGLRGTEEAPILLKAQPGVEIRRPAGSRNGIFLTRENGGSAHVIIDGFKITGARLAGILVHNSHHVTIRNCVSGDNRRWGIQTSLCDFITVENCELYGSRDEHGLYFSTTDHPVARGNRIHHNAACGIHMNGDRREGGDGMISFGLLENNVITECGLRGGAAINMDGVEKTVVRNNLIHDNHSGGITVFRGDGARSGTHNEFYNNTVYFQSGNGRFGLELVRGATDTVVLNNIFVGGLGPALYIDAASLRGLKSDYNITFQHDGALPVEFDGKRLAFQEWQRTMSQDAHSRSVDPAFVDVTGGDFRLRVDSPGIDAGTPIDSVIRDLTGQARPSGGAWDIGAYEH